MMVDECYNLALFDYSAQPFSVYIMWKYINMFSRHWLAFCGGQAIVHESQWKAILYCNEHNIA